MTLCQSCIFPLVGFALQVQFSAPVNIVNSYLSKKSKDHFRQTMYHKIYSADGMVILKENKIVQDIRYWLGGFQQIVNKAEEKNTFNLQQKYGETIGTSLLMRIITTLKSAQPKNHPCCIWGLSIALSGTFNLENSGKCTSVEVHLKRNYRHT